MSEGWTAPKSGWYRQIGRISPGNEPVYLGTERPEDADMDQLMRVEIGEYETRIYQNSGGSLAHSLAQVIPKSTWVTLAGREPWTAVSFDRGTATP